MRRIRVLGTVLLAVLLVSAGAAVGQDVTATITGTVTDSTGAAVAGATITAKSVERGTTFTGTTNDLGLYRITQLPIGNYDLRIEKTGFQSALHPSFALALNQIARVDVELKVGQITDTVEVTAGAPILKTEATQIDTIINSATTPLTGSAERCVRSGAVHLS
jgi:type 1 fimbria pilin